MDGSILQRSFRAKYLRGKFGKTRRKIDFEKPGKHIAFERPALIQKGRGSGVLYNEWFLKKHPKSSAEVNVSEFEKKQGIKNS